MVMTLICLAKDLEAAALEILEDLRIRRDRADPA